MKTEHRKGRDPAGQARPASWRAWSGALVGLILGAGLGPFVAYALGEWPSWLAALLHGRWFPALAGAGLGAWLGRRDLRPALDRRDALTLLGLFALALVVRVLFWLATDDSAGPYSACFKGDAQVWIAWAQALAEGRAYDGGVPLRPPLNAWLIASSWNGEPGDLGGLRFAWCLMGATSVAVLYLVVRQRFSLAVAAMAAGAAACSTELIVHSNSLNNETPYLLLVLIALGLQQRLARGASTGLLASWALVNAVACLTRAEHPLLLGLGALHLGFCWWRQARPRAPLGTLGLRAALVLGTFLAVLLPWHIQTGRAIEEFNETELLLNRQGYERIVDSLPPAARALPWDPEAVAWNEEQAGFTRKMNAAVLTAIVHHRGGDRVRREDCELLAEAYGSAPARLATRYFVSIYGPLNFYLANNSRSDGGFSRDQVFVPTKLTPEEDYPECLREGFAPKVLQFDYAPHSRAFNHGYALGLEWISANPGEFLALVGRKLSIFAAGSGPRFTGFALPLGMDGVRRPVDLLTPRWSAWSLIWTIVFLLVAALGWIGARPRADLVPWLLFLLSRVVVAALFFGYARHGVLIQPVLFLGVALAIERWVLAPRAARGSGTTRPGGRRVLALLGLIVALESVRTLVGVEIEMDGVPVNGAPLPDEKHHRAVEVEVFYGR